MSSAHLEPKRAGGEGSETPPPAAPDAEMLPAATICLALIPAEDEPNKVLAVTKVVGLTLLLLLGGAAVYITGKRRRA